jgi:hypothetical protein
VSKEVILEFLVSMEFEPRASLLLGQCFYGLSYSTNPFFAMGFSMIGSHKLFATGLALNGSLPGHCLLSS